MTLSILLSVRFSIEHYIQLGLLILVICFFRQLQKANLKILLPISFLFFVFDFLNKNVFHVRQVLMVGMLEFLLIVFGVYLYPSLKRTKTSIMVLYLLVYCVIDQIAIYMGNHGWYNLFLYDLANVLAAPLLFLLYYNMLQPTWHIKVAYIMASIVSSVFFFYDFIAGSTGFTNAFTSVIYGVEMFILACITLGRLVFDEKKQREPDTSSVFRYCCWANNFIYRYCCI